MLDCEKNVTKCHKRHYEKHEKVMIFLDLMSMKCRKEINFSTFIIKIKQDDAPAATNVSVTKEAILRIS
jgi:hypothetical protein